MTNIKLNQNIDELEPDLVSKRDELDNEIDNSINALLNENKGLVIIGGNSESLNYLTTKLFSELNAEHNVRLSDLSSTSTTALINRFNEIMASVPIDAALRPADPNGMINVLKVNNAHLIDQDQWILLSQLCNDFPGAQIRFVLLINADDWNEFAQVLEHFKVDMHMHFIEQPKVIDPTSILQIAEENGFKNEIEDLLAGLAENSEETSNDQNIIIDQDQSYEQIENKSSRGVQKSKPFNWPILSGVLASFLIGATFLLFYKPTVLQSLSNEAVKMYQEFEWDEKLNALTQVDFIAPILTDHNAVETMEPLIKEDISSRALSDLTVLKELDIKKLEEKRAIDDRGNIIKNPSLMDKNYLLISESENSDYFVQHNVFSEIDAAENFIIGNPSLKDAALVGLQILDETHFALLSGPFPNKASATFYAMTPGMPKDFWVRSAEPLKEVIEATDTKREKHI